MYIVPRIEEIVKRKFGMIFDRIEYFYLKNLLILVQGFLANPHTSINAVASNESNEIFRTTLTRFMSAYDSFWNAMKATVLSRLRNCITGSPEEVDQFRQILIMDDTLIKRRGKKIPFAFKQYDHCENRYVHGQCILTIGQMNGNTFQPLDMQFAKSSKDPSESYDSKLDMSISWLRDNEVRKSLVIADSWYTNSILIEACKNWFDSEFIGQVKDNLILQVAGETIKAKKLKSLAKMNRSVIVNGNTIKYHSYLANVKSIRIPVKLVVTELEGKPRAILICSDTKLSAKMIIQYYSLKWSIETFFKFAKQNLSLSRCQIRSEAGQIHYLILITIICQVFNDLLEILKIHQKKIEIWRTFDAIRIAVAYLSVMVAIGAPLDIQSFGSSKCTYSKGLQLMLELLFLPCTL